MHTKWKSLLLFIILIGLLTSSGSPATAAPMLSPEQLTAQIVAEINAYRQANGFSALPVNVSLAYLAKTQSEHQAAIQSITHTGPGGTTPKERAAAYGYGGGGPFFMSEIIYGGHNATPASAIGWWKNSALHNSVLLDKRYAELGAGVAYSGDRVYFSVELAWTGNYIAYDGEGGDSAGNVNTGISPSGSGSGSGSETSPGEVVSIPITRAEENSDGSVIHIVQAGQDLWTIAAVYETDLQTIYALNGLSPGDFIFPGDEIIIHLPTAPPTATASSTPENTPTPVPPTLTRAPEIGEAFSFVPEKSAIPKPSSPAAAKPENLSQTTTTRSIENRTAISIIIASLIIIIAAVIISMIMGHPSKKHNIKM